MPQIQKEVDYLRHLEYGKMLVDKANADYLPEKLRIPYHYIDGQKVLTNRPYPRGNVFVVGAIQRAIRELGIKDIRVALPDEIFSMYADCLPEHKRTWNDFGVVIYSNQGINQDYAMNIIKETGLKKEDLPAVVFGLETEISDKFNYGAKLVVTEQTGVIKKANALNSDHYRTSSHLSFADIVRVGYLKPGDIGVFGTTNNARNGLRLMTRQFDTDILAWFDYLGNLHGAGRVILKRVKK